MTGAQKHSRMVRERDEHGQYVETVGLDDVLAVFDQVRGPVITSSDVSEALDCTNEAARQKLGRLHDSSRVAKRKTGRTTVWWQTGGERITPDDRGDRHAETAREIQEKRSEENPDTQQEEATETAESDAITEALDGWEYGRNEEERKASREVARNATEWLRESGETARKADVPLADIADDDPEGRAIDTIWTQVVREAWEHAVEQGFIAKPTARKYQWAGSTADTENTSSGIYDPTKEFES